MTPTEAQPVSGTAPGIAPTLPTVVSVQGVAGGTPVGVSATIPGTVDVSDRVGRQLGIVSVTGQPIGTDVTDKPARQLGIVSITGQPIGISAAALPLPTGAATEATLATRLADATFTGRINTQGQKAMAASTPVVLASDQTFPPASGLRSLLTAGDFTTAQSSAFQFVDGYRGVWLYLNVITAPGGGETLTLDLNALGFILAVFPAVAVVGFTSYMTYPGILAADFQGTAARTIPMPNQWVARVTPSGAGTWSVVVNYYPII